MPFTVFQFPLLLLPFLPVAVFSVALFTVAVLSANQTPAHKALKLAVDFKSGDIPQHDWNRPAGRPRTTWMSQIVRDAGLTAADAWALADDRSTCRALRPTANYAQQ